MVILLSNTRDKRIWGYISERTERAVRTGIGGVSVKNHANTENVPIAPRYRGNRELMHKKSIPFYGLFVTEKYERNGL